MPDKAWAVFEEIVRLRPEDDEVLAGIWSQFEWLLEHHADHYYERIVTMVGSHPRLTRIAPWQRLRRDYFAPNYFTPSELGAVWLVHSDSASEAHELDSKIRDDPDNALALVMEIIHRGSGYRFSAYDLMSPLRDLLRQHGPEVIDRVEREAEASVAIRCVLWSMRRQQHDPPNRYDVPSDVWTRAMQAAGDTTEYNSEEPSAVVNPLPPELERIVQAWFVYWYTFWAWETLNDVVEKEPEEGWRVIRHMVDHANSDDRLGSVAAGPLERLLECHGPQFVDRVEALAGEDERFRRCLGGVWLNTKRLPRDLIERFKTASGEVLQVIEVEPVEPELNSFEHDILNALLAGDDPVLEVLRLQAGSATAADRMIVMWTYTLELTVPSGAPRAGELSFTITDLQATLHFVAAPVEFHLQVENGRLKELSGFVQDDEWPSPILVQKLTYVKEGQRRGEYVETERRDLEALRKRWNREEE